MARELKTNTAIIVAIGPFLDKTDGVTLETGLTITNEKITLIAETDDGSAPTLILDNVTGATSGTDNDLNYITNNDAGMMQIELSAANLNRLGRMRLIITNAATHVPVWEDFEVVSAQYYDAKYGTGNFSADAKMISGDATAADNLEAACDGNTYNVGGGAVVAASCTASTPALIADAICDEVINTGHAVANSLAKLIYDNLNAPVATVDTVVDGIATDVAAILVDTGTTLDGKIDTIDGILDDLHGTDIPAIKTVVDANGVKLTAIQGKTDMFPVIWFSP